MEVHFKDFVLNSSNTEISEKRKRLLKEIDGDVASEYVMVFWKKPIVVQDTFKLLIFLLKMDVLHGQRP